MSGFPVEHVECHTKLCAALFYEHALDLYLPEAACPPEPQMFKVILDGARMLLFCLPEQTRQVPEPQPFLRVWRL